MAVATTLLLSPVRVSAWSEGPTIKAGTYNLFTSDSRRKFIQRDSTVSPQRYWCNSAAAVADMIAALDCDLLGVQEVCDSIWGVKGSNDIRKLVADRGLKYEWILYPNTRHGHISYDVAIACRSDMFEVLKSGIFYLGGNFDEPVVAEGKPRGSARPCVWAHLRHKASGKEMYFLSAHFLVGQKGADGKYDNSGNKFNAQMVYEWVEKNLPDGVPSIFVGDLNADQKAKHWGSMGKSRWMDCRDWFKGAGTLDPDIAEWGTQNLKDESAYSKWYPDHIMFNGFRPLKMTVDRRKFATADGSLHYPSDHLPVTCTLTFRDYNDYGPKTPSPVAKKGLRAMSFNMRYFNNLQDKENGWDHRKFAIPLMIKDLEPDVMGTQEPVVKQNEYIARECPDYKYVGTLRDGEDHPRGEMASIFYNTRTVELLEWGSFWLSGTPKVPSKSWDSAFNRNAVWAHMRHKSSGKEFVFVNTHLDHKGEVARKKGLDIILDTLKVLNRKKLPVVLTGDFNVKPEHHTLDRIRTEMKNSRECAVSSDTKYSFNGFGKSWTGIIDYIWFNGFKKCDDFKVVSRKYGHVNYISDHYPIRADLVF